LGEESQSAMSGEGRSFRRKTVKFWDIWTMPPKIVQYNFLLIYQVLYWLYLEYYCSS